MEEFFLFIFALTALFAGVGVIVYIVRAILNHLRSRSSGSTQKSGGSSLTASELQALVRHAVEEAVQPLEAKLDRLEQRQEAEAVAIEARPRLLEERGGAHVEAEPPNRP